MLEKRDFSLKSDPTISLGVVGHRLDKLTAHDLIHLQAPVSTVLDSLHGLETDGRNLRLITSLAEGADRLVMRLAVDRDIPVTVVLPFLRQRFERDFPSPASRDEFYRLLSQADAVIEPDQPSDETGDGYYWASEQIVAAADVLLAIWNGQSANGPGGTANTIDSALLSDIPVIWLQSDPPYGLDIVEPEKGLNDSPLHHILQTLASDPSTNGAGAVRRLSRGMLHLS